MSRKHIKKAASVRTGERATKERRMHDGGVTKEIVSRDSSGSAFITREKARFACILERYRKANHIDHSELAAGVKFQHAYLRAVLRINVYDVGGGCKDDPEAAAHSPIYSEDLLKAAYKKLTKKQKWIIIRVCGHDEYAGHTNEIDSLRRGLRRLAKLWGV